MGASLVAQLVKNPLKSKGKKNEWQEIQVEILEDIKFQRTKWITDKAKEIQT